MMKILILITPLFFISLSSADNVGSSNKRMDALEAQVKALQEKVDKMESVLNKPGGLNIMANVSCEIHTPFDGDYVATELSETAARNSVMEQCRQKLSDKTQCLPQFVKCKK